MKIFIRLIMLIMLGGILLAIFNFSEQEGPDSRALSKRVAGAIIDRLPQYKNISEKERNRLILKSQSIVRKAAHVTEYMVLGLTVTIFLNTFNFKKKNCALIALMIGMMYAASDEIHQIFTPNRTPLVKDVFIDTGGVILGIILALILTKVVGKLAKVVKILKIRTKETVGGNI